MNHQLPAGLIDHNYEFFTDNGLHAYCLNHRHVRSFQEFDRPLILTLEAQMEDKFPATLAGARAMGFETPMAALEKGLTCLYGGFDTRPDMIDGVLQEPEYWPCPQRGVCPHEGVACARLKTGTGEFLTAREIQVVRLTAEGQLDKTISDNLEISIGTVTKHQANIRRKTKLFRKPDITRFAYQNNLV